MDHAFKLVLRQISAAYVAQFATRLGEARGRINASGQSKDKSEAATHLVTGKECLLFEGLHGIQSAAKQKHRIGEDGDDPTHQFPTEGYLIGQRLNPNRATLLQNAEALIARATADALPGRDAPAIALVQGKLDAYRHDKNAQRDAEEARGEDRLSRDALVKRINSRRLAIQHAADALWPYTDPANRPTRRLFHLPLSRPLNS